MAITAADIKFFHSGGAGNTDPDASLGGIRSTTEVTNDALQNLFDDASNAELTSGTVEYRCIYVFNDSGSDTWLDVRMFIQTPTPSADTVFAIGLDPAGVGDGSTTGVATTVANETTAPAGVTFSAPTDYTGGLQTSDLSAGQGRALWLRRTISAGAAAAAEDSMDLRAQGNTL